MHLGSGNVNLKGWLNVDLDAPEADMHLDLRKKLPFGNELISHIYNEHFIEHITREDAVNLLKECYRILKSDGVLRLSTPDLKFIAVAYLSRNITEWHDVAWRPGSPCSLINEAMRLWGHQFVYDAEELVAVLIEAGFNSIQFVPYGESQDKELVGLETRPFHNELLVEARKDNSSPKVFGILENKKRDEGSWLDEVHTEILKQIELYQQTTSNQSIHIASLEADLVSRDQHIASLEADLVSRDQHIASLEADLVSRDQHAHDFIAHINAIEKELISRGQQIISLQADFSSVSQHSTELMNHVSNVEAALAYRSTTWRMKLKSAMRSLIK